MLNGTRKKTFYIVVKIDAFVKVDFERDRGFRGEKRFITDALRMANCLRSLRRVFAI
jgi:hypothetical protein